MDRALSFFSEGKGADAGDAQALLFQLPEDVEEARERAGIYSGARLKVRRPGVYEAIIELLGQGQSVRAIKRVCGVHHSTIAAVAAAEGVAIDTSRERVLTDLRMLRGLLVDSLTDAVMDGKLKPGEHAFALTVVIDKVELLDGNATVRIETGQTGDAPRTFEEMFGKMKRVKMGSGAGENGELAGVEAVRVHALGSGLMDMKAPDLQSEAGNAGDSAGIAAEIGAGDLEGGGGGSLAGGLPEAPTH